MKMERKQRVQVRDLCREGEWRSSTSVHDKLAQAKRKSQKIGEAGAEASSL